MGIRRENRKNTETVIIKTIMKFSGILNFQSYILIVPPGAWKFVCRECCVLSGRGLCDELITGLEESYRLWCVVVCDLGTSRMRSPWPALGRSATKKNIYIYIDRPMKNAKCKNFLILTVTCTACLCETKVENNNWKVFHLASTRQNKETFH
jgi:hypothetical protein